MRRPRFELVRSDAAQPWHARFRAANGQVVWTTEQYARRRGCLNAVLSICDAERFHLDESLIWVAWGNSGWLEVRTVDERYVAPPVVLSPPFFLGEWTEFQGEGRAKTAVRVPFWHDREYHWRFCADPCEEGTPPEGSEVRSRMGIATYRERDHA